MGQTYLADDYIPTAPEPAYVALATLVEQRLIAFAKEKDMDIQEVTMLLSSTNPVWQQEALTFQMLYDATWQAFYASTATTWQEIEAELPVLAWESQE
jgi:hypothetical protein